VEIDATMTDIAKKYFDLRENPRLQSMHQDARLYLNQSQKKYDVILGDAFGSYYSLPYQLTTQEAVQKKYDILSNDGIVLLNIVSALEGEKSLFLQAEYKTYQSIFPYVSVIPIRTNAKEEVQNIMLIAAKNTESLPHTSKNPELQDFLDRKTTLNIDPETPLLTDDYAPVEYLISKLMN